MKHHFSRLIAPPLLLGFCVWASSGQAQVLTQVGTLSTLRGPVGATAKGNTAYLANFGSNTLEAVDISNPTAPVSRQVVTNPATRARSVVVGGGRVYLGCFGVGTSNSSGISSFSLQNPTNPILLGKLDVTGSPTFISASNQVLCAITTNTNPVNNTSVTNLLVVDLSLNVKATVPLGTGNYEGRVLVSGTLAYVTSTAGLAIYDVSNPAVPVLRHTSNATISAVGGGLGYGVKNGVLQVYDLSTPTAPVLRGTTLVGSATNNYLVSATGTTVFVATKATLQVVDAGTSATPIVQATLSVDEFVYDVNANGSYAYLVTQITLPDGTTTQILRVLRYQNPSRSITTFAPARGSEGASVTIKGAGLAGATVVQFDDVAATSFSVVSPTEISAVVPAGATTGPITVTTPNGTVASLSNFVVSGQPTASRQSSLADSWSIHPNPAQGKFWVDMPPLLANAESAQAQLHDNLGRVVRRYALSKADLKTGTRTQIDVEGIPTGIYSLRLAIGEQVAVKRVVIE